MFEYTCFSFFILEGYISFLVAVFDFVTFRVQLNIWNNKIRLMSQCLIEYDS